MEATGQPPPLPKWTRWIRFERVDSEKNLFREYGIAIGQNLLDEWVVSSSWGRIGGPKRVKDTYFASKGEAMILSKMAVIPLTSRGDVMRSDI